MRLLISAVYVYAAAAKLDADWLTGRTAVELLSGWTAQDAGLGSVGPAGDFKVFSALGFIV